MNIVELEARLVDNKHREYKFKVNATILENGPHIPIRVHYQKRIFELTKVKKGILVYSQPDLLSAKQNAP